MDTRRYLLFTKPSDVRKLDNLSESSHSFCEAILNGWNIDIRVRVIGRDGRDPSGKYSTWSFCGRQSVGFEPNNCAAGSFQRMSRTVLRRSPPGSTPLDFSPFVTGRIEGCFYCHIGHHSKSRAGKELFARKASKISLITETGNTYQECRFIYYAT